MKLTSEQIKTGLLSENIDTRAYAKHIYYRLEFQDKEGVPYRADILTRSPIWYGLGRGTGSKPSIGGGRTIIADFDNAGELVKGAFSPIIISRKREDQTDPMYTSTATLKLWSDTDDKFLHLTQETDAVMLYIWRHEQRRNAGDSDDKVWRLLFSGVLDQSQYQEPFSKDGRYFVDFVFQDYGQLKRIKHRLREGDSLAEHLRVLLSQRFDSCGYKDDLPNENIELQSYYDVYPSTKPLRDDKENKTAFECLDILLRNFSLTLMQGNNVYERIGQSQIYIDKGAPYYNEPRLIPFGTDQVMTIVQPAKEVEITIDVQENNNRAKTNLFDIKDDGYEYDILRTEAPLVCDNIEIRYSPVGGNKSPYSYKSLKRPIEFTIKHGKVLSSKEFAFYPITIRTIKKTAGESESFLALYWNSEVHSTSIINVPSGGSHGVFPLQSFYPFKGLTPEKPSIPLMRDRVIAPYKWLNVNGAHFLKSLGRILEGDFARYYPSQNTYRVEGRNAFKIENEVNKNFDEVFTLCEALPVNNIKENALLHLDLKLKIGSRTALFREYREDELIGTDKDFARGIANGTPPNRGALLLVAILGVNSDNMITHHLRDVVIIKGKADQTAEYSETKYYWQRIINPIAVNNEYKNSGAVINGLRREHLCALPYGTVDMKGVRFDEWQNVAFPLQTIIKGSHITLFDHRKSNIMQEPGLYLSDIPEGVKSIVFAVAPRVEIAFNSNPQAQPFSSFHHQGGWGEIEYSPSYAFVKDPVLEIIDFDNYSNDEGKKISTRLKTIYSKANTDSIKETLLYDDRLDISTASPHRVFANNIKPPVQGATFGAMSFGDLRAFDILNKKALGLMNIEGTFKANLKRNWGVFYYKNGKHKGKYLTSMEEIDIKASTSKMTLHELSQLAPYVVEKDTSDN